MSEFRSSSADASVVAELPSASLTPLSGQFAAFCRRDWKKSFGKSLQQAFESDQPGDACQLLRQALPWSQPELTGQILAQELLLLVRAGALEPSTAAGGESDEFPSWPAHWESACDFLEELVQRHVTPMVAISQRKRSAARPDEQSTAAGNAWEQLWLQFLQESAEMACDRLPEQLVPVFTVRTLSLIAGLLLLEGKLSPAAELQGWNRLAEAATLFQTWGELPRSEAETPLTSLLLQGELPVLLGLMFPESKSLGSLVKQGRHAWAEELDAWTDNDGTPHARLLSVLPWWVAASNRLQTLLDSCDEKGLSRAAQERWVLLLERAASLTTGSGHLVLGQSTAAPWKMTLLGALTLLPQRKKYPWTRPVLHRLQNDSRASRFRLPEDESAATQTDWGQLACLRNNWDAGADFLAIDFSSQSTPVELIGLSLPILRGAWNFRATSQGATIDWSAANDWAGLCWYQQAGCDYFELRLELDSFVIDRQLFLSRTDHFAILADSFKTADPKADVALEWTLPLAEGWRSAETQADRSLLMKQGRAQLRLIPLALPQDRLIKPDGELKLVEEHSGPAVRLNQRGQQNLCLPLLIDWSPERRRAACDWTKLTVTQERQILTPQQAFASRVRIGQHQWFFLRNLEYSGLPRAALGQHTDAESIIAEFPHSGPAERLVEVHYEEQ